MSPAKKKAATPPAPTEEPGSGVEASVDRGPGPEHAETLVSVHGTPAAEPDLEED